MILSLSDHDPESPAVVHDGQTWSYAELDRRALRIAQNLAAAGIEPGDRIVTLLPNCHELVALYLAAFRAGFTIVPLDVRYHSALINFSLRHSGAKVVVIEGSRVAEISECEALADVELRLVTGAGTHAGYRPFRRLLTTRPTESLADDLRDDDVSLVFYTSGTTARPKGVTLTRDCVACSVSKAGAILKLNADDVTLIAAPISRPMALRTQLLPALAAGATIVLLGRFDPQEYLQALRQKPGATILALLPAALRQVLFHPELTREDLGCVRLCICGGDYIPADVFERFRELTGIELTEQCGMTETGMYAVNPPYGRKKAGSIGLPYYGVQISIVNDKGVDVRWGESGEIAVRSPFAMDGYWNDTAATRRVMRDGWIRTGDVGRIDDDGYIWMEGRKKDIIVRGGSNISPAAVESALQKHPCVCEVCVVGVDDPELGQAVTAFVTLTADADVNQIEDELLALAKKELPEYMVPETICVLPRLPGTGSGKIDRERLKWIAESTDESTLAILLG
ncbi:MAG: class I adenylate-forming enzyme family protein [Planctomycetota bacterium]|nr:class I adenylate-forming enzyme family protein [Planctomycetota bacterium]